MRGMLMFIVGTFLAGGVTFAQKATPDAESGKNPAASSAAAKPAGSPSAQPQPQPQGPTGPTNTTSGGAPAWSPQGDTPAGMQPHPQDPKQGIGQNK